MSKPLAFVTFDKFPELTPDDQIAVAALEAEGIAVQAVCWDAAHADWGAFAALILRSTWDYHLRLDEFRNWLDHLNTVGVPVWNPTDILRWNMDKLYLQDLEDNGVAITPSVWLPKDAKANLLDLMRQKQWERAVIKPRVSAGADDTFMVTINDAVGRQADFSDLLARKAVLVQPFMEELASQGEWSLLFFDKQFSHAVLKQPDDGDFRVQIQHGGRQQAATPPEALVTQAAAILAEIEAPLLYARVDGVDRDGQLLLMELELLEPSLFFDYDENAAKRFATTLIDYLKVSAAA